MTSGAEPLVDRGRVRIALGSFTVGGFAIGCTEFSAMGLLPRIASEYQPTVFAASADVATANVSVFTWGYALGVVIGALAIGPLAARFRERHFLIALLLAMAVLTALTASAPLLGGVALLRIAAALPHATFIGVGAITCARLLGRGSAGRGVAVVLGGLTIASVVGAPAATWLGNVIGWRWTYRMIAVVFALAAVGLVISLPMRPRSGSARAARPRRAGPIRVPGRMWMTILVFALVNAGLFAVMTFIGPLWMTAGGSAGTIALTLAVSGAGMTVGNYVGGHLTDRSPRAAAWLLAVTIAGGLIPLILAPSMKTAVLVGFGLVGMAMGSGGPYIQVKLMSTTPDRPEVGSSMNSLAANLGSVVGSVSASWAVMMREDVRAAAVLGMILSACGGLGALALRRSRSRHLSATE